MALNWTGVIRKNILKLRLAFDSSVSIPEREKQLRAYATGLADSSNFKVLETTHYPDGSQLKAQLPNR
ncbi:MAG: hypothetical protein MJZ66_03115 [Bacteroidales bacterium]|nr:hypothetical protein [Bacteroidales bacterium]MCQ2252786.1 hypothetical protein [Bacteroidales bacterium]